MRFLPVGGARKHRRAKSLLLPTVLASVGAFVALYALWLNDRTHWLEGEKVADERFARSVEMLGNEADQVRVDAMHSLV